MSDNIRFFYQSNEMPKVCLNMIVRNESRIIHRILGSVAPYIDCYCICDTGSTDNTIELIETFFKEKNIPGKVIQEPFRDFGYNRSFALKACEDMDAEYILLLDADMIFWVNPKYTPDQFKTLLLTKGDAHHIFQGTDLHYYKNTRIVRNKSGCTYWGVTHEYVKTPPNLIYNLLEKDQVFIRDVGDGGCKTDKFVRDIELLKRGLETEPNNDRYTFYLANSYKDSHQYDNAIETYKKRTQLGGWHEEIWQSFHSIAHCYKIKGDMGNAIFYWMEAYNSFPDRVENLYEIINYYRNNGKNKLAYPFYILAKNELNKKHKLDYLFMQRDVYDYKIDYEMTIIGYYCNTDNIDLAALSMKVLNYPRLEEHIAKNILSNYKFYSKNAQDWAKEYKSNVNQNMSKNVELLKNIGKDLLRDKLSGSPPEFCPSTPTLCINNKGNLVANVRFVNYRIDDKGNYINFEHIESKNVIAEFDMTCSPWKKISETLMNYDKSHDNVYVGLEDVRLFTMQNDESNTIYYNANRGLDRNTIIVETGTVNAVDGTTPPSTFVRIENQHGVEKNWVLLQGGADNKQKMIYGWSPLVIGDVETDSANVGKATFNKTHSIDTPYFFKYLRGSTNGVVIGDEIWFICHSVSYEDRRYYYHLFVVLDRTTLSLKKYTPFFTFEKSKVEYTLGFVHLKDVNELFIGYSVMDNRTEYVSLSKAKIDGMMITA